MGPDHAKRIAEELRGQVIAGWTVGDYVAHGGSGVILKATREHELAAIKIYDPDLVTQETEPVTLERIARQKRLALHPHPYLLSILGGGKCNGTGHLYLLMPLLQQENLTTVLLDVPRANIRLLISQIASAAEFLDSLKTAHRDIKPDNILISSNFNHATLLDLGVVKPLGAANITDHGRERPMIATTRWAPPELIRRAEGSSPEDWLAVTFYQLGAVLHDMIMKKRLFDNYQDTDVAGLIHAIENEPPAIFSDDVPADLVKLARDCLQKNPRLRLEFVNWGCFRQTPETVQESPWDKLSGDMVHAGVAIVGGKMAPSTGEEKRGVAIQRLNRELEDRLRQFCVRNSGILPPVRIRFIDTPQVDSSLVATLEYVRSASAPAVLEILLNTYLSEPETAAVSIRASARWTEHPPAGRVVATNDRAIYGGAFDAQLFETRLETEIPSLISEIFKSVAQGAPAQTALAAAPEDRPNRKPSLNGEA